MNEIKDLLITGRTNVKLSKWDAGDTFGKNQEELTSELSKIQEIMAELQYRLYIENKKSLLIVLQGMDTSGKDGTIRHVIKAFNPVSCKVDSFKVPSDDEMAHDFLWRIHAKVPQNRFIEVFNRSHYEDIIEVGVQNLLPKHIWSKRYKQINQFEKLLAESNVKIVKFFLYISKQEQGKRLQERLSHPSKRWKVNEEDFEKRKKWDEYIQAYEEVIGRCSTQHAPWYIIPADKKWFRNWIIASIITNALQKMKIKYPKYIPLKNIQSSKNV
jgi:PPK2 family polyphosphate:nucleotide phosphotransferase